MTTWIRDPFQVKRLEQKLGRKLSEAELEGEAPVRVKDANGKVKLEWIKRYNIRDFYGE